MNLAPRERTHWKIAHIFHCGFNLSDWQNINNVKKNYMIQKIIVSIILISVLREFKDEIRHEPDLIQKNLCLAMSWFTERFCF